MRLMLDLSTVKPQKTDVWSYVFMECGGLCVMMAGMSGMPL